MPDDAKPSGFVPPYISFKTLLGLIERMVQEEPPARIDKSYLDNYSGGYQTQVLAALTSLRLISEEGDLSENLKDLVTAPDSRRPEVVARVIKDQYQPLLALSQNSTQQQLVDAFSELAPQVTGDTRRKAIAFFLGACQYANIPVSKHWKTPRVQAKPGSKPRDRQDRSYTPAIEPAESHIPVDAAAGPANLRQLELRSGGMVTLGLSVDLFEMSTDDRTFVFRLIDEMSKYEEQRQLQPAPSSFAPTPEPPL